MIKVSVKYYRDEITGGRGNHKYIEVETEYGYARADVKTRRIYWGEDNFWCNWVKIPELKRVYGGPSTYGDIELFV